MSQWQTWPGSEVMGWGPYCIVEVHCLNGGFFPETGHLHQIFTFLAIMVKIYRFAQTTLEASNFSGRPSHDRQVTRIATLIAKRTLPGPSLHRYDASASVVRRRRRAAFSASSRRRRRCVRVRRTAPRGAVCRACCSRPPCLRSRPSRK